MRKFRRWTPFAVLLLAMLLAGLTGCGSNASEKSNNTQEKPKSEAASNTQLKKLEIGGGAMGGVYYITANAFADVIQKQMNLNIPITASVTEGSSENLRLLDQGRIELATVAANAAYPAWNGEKPFDKEYKNFRVIMRVFPNPTVFFALANKGITNIGQLEGKRIGYGAGPTTWDHLTGPFLEAHGVDTTKVKKVYGSWEDLCNQVRDGLIDASIGNVSAGLTLMPAISALASEKELKFLDWDPKAIDQVSAKYPYFEKIVVKPGILPGLNDKEYLTADIGSQQLVARADLPDDFVYQLTKTIHTNLAKMSNNVNVYKYLVNNPEFAAKKLGDIPFHPGAERYWKEVGLWKE